jgi:hypothetical protein
MCSTRTLAHTGDAFISSCADCKTVFIWHRNILLNFSPEDFSSFKRMLDDLDFEDCSFNFLDNISRIIIKTPKPGISFAFTENEWNNFNQAVTEAIYMQQVYDLMS